MFGQETAQVGNRRFVSPSEYGGHPRRPYRMLKSQTYCGPCSAGGTPTDGIYNHQHLTASGAKQSFKIFRCSRFLHSVLGEVGAHGGNQLIGVGHRSILAIARVEKLDKELFGPSKLAQMPHRKRSA